MTIQFRYLTQEEVIKAGGLDMRFVNDTVEDVFKLFAQGECILPHKVVLRWGDATTERTTHGHMNAMPCYVGGQYNMAGIKWATGFYRNPIEYGLPAISSLVVLNDPMKGFPVAVMDGTLISAMRTGAQAGVAAKYLARKKARTVGIVGAGVQARTLLMSVNTSVPDLTEARVFDIRPERSAAFCQEMRDRVPSIKLSQAASLEEALDRVDVLMSATTAVTPVIKRGSFPPGVLFCQMGSFECELEAVRDFDKLVVDNWDQVQHREIPVLAMAKVAGIISDADIYAELGEIVIGKKPGRESDSERVFFHAVGTGLLDVAIGTRILHSAENQGIGTMLDLWKTPAFV